MAISPVMRRALEALSAVELSPTENYALERALVDVTHPRLFKPFHRVWDYKVVRDGADIPVRIYAPEAEGNFPLLLFFHGGGWVTGNIGSYDRVCAQMAEQTGHTVVSVDYRLAPENKFPVPLEDCYAAALELFRRCGTLGASAEEITLIGDSAGGNLAAAVSLLARDRGEFAPKRQILIYPAVASDHGESSPFASVHENGAGYILTNKRINAYMELYSSEESDYYNPYFAPLTAADLRRQPETLVITAEYDPLRDEGEAYAAALREAGGSASVYRVADALHGFFSLSTRFRAVREAYTEINRFLGKGGSR
ncbi:alpha/beta hydrolase [Oscillospiraceae bacterium OttesenSCG-928-F05]|nr:alpha/beta hydrolase [Oscillospiraceae bacterium OttesenSCG-928-F05]